jgi:hypothetical protein
MYFVDIFFCLFCNFRGSKPTCTRTRTQTREKQRNGLSIIFAYIYKHIHFTVQNKNISSASQGRLGTENVSANTSRPIQSNVCSLISEAM